MRIGSTPLSLFSGWFMRKSRDARDAPTERAASERLTFTSRALFTPCAIAREEKVAPVMPSTFSPMVTVSRAPLKRERKLSLWTRVPVPGVSWMSTMRTPFTSCSALRPTIMEMSPMYPEPTVFTQ